MFSELPKLFGRDFAIGFFLPGVLYIVATLGIVAEFGLLPSLISIFPPQIKTDVLLSATTIGLTSWLIGVLLLALNRDY